jgi:predicted nuclease with TOPRIM domain
MTPAVVGLIGVLISGGFIGGIVAFRKSGKESESIAAQTLIAVNAELRLELARRNEDLRRRDEEVKELRDRLAALEARVAKEL